jgi:AcrR family transcriptional regulator
MTRADARRNYERLLAAAEEAFVGHGVDASLNDIARRAGVGPATLYRHFPTRDALLEALLMDRYNDLAEQARTLLGSLPPRDALVAWLRVFMAHVTTYRGLATPVKAALHDESSALFSSCHAMKTAWHELLVRAKEAGVVRTDVNGSDVLRLANAVAWATDGRPDEADRLLSLVLEGIRA